MFFFTFRQVLANNRSWIFMAALIFMICTLALYFTTVPDMAEAEEITANQLDQLQDLLAIILGSHPLIGILLVFMNNFITMSQMLLLGFAAGISPLLTLGLNGAFVGTLLALSVHDGTDLARLIFFGILPHGILELSAFFICGALGLKFGYHCIAAPLPAKTRLESFRHIWKETIAILPLVVALLFVAAAVEMLITPFLLNQFLP